MSQQTPNLITPQQALSIFNISPMLLHRLKSLDLIESRKHVEGLDQYFESDLRDLLGTDERSNR